MSRSHIMNREKIATLWLQLSEIYGTRFVNQYGEKDHSGLWHQALSDIPEACLQLGLMAMLHDIRFETWPPNCTQFRHLCLSHLKAEELPNVHRAFDEIRDKLSSTKPDWSKMHRAILFTVAQLGVESLSDARVDRAWAAFSEMYERVCQGIMKGKQLPEVDDEKLQIQTSKFHKPPRLSLILKGNL